jgi:hypothetical protein
MGFFSFECKRCGKSLIGVDAVRGERPPIFAWMNDVVVMLRNGTRLTGEYDGYGRVDGKSFYDYASDEPCCYHRACWELAGMPEYDGPSNHADDQGWFFDDEEYNIPDPRSA